MSVVIAEELLKQPLWRESDLGKPMPDSPHAVSVCLPLWRHVVGYEEADPHVVDKLQLGYPRFFLHPAVQCLVQPITEEGRGVLPFPSARTAEGCLRFLRDKLGVSGNLAGEAPQGVHIVSYPLEAKDTAKRYWQHFGLIVSSRHALASTSGGARPDGTGAKAAIRSRIGGLTGAAEDEIFLYPSGMGALTAALRAAQARRPAAKSIQLGFPYVDVLKIQTEWGPGAHFFPGGGDADLDAIESVLSREPISAVICEFFGNPLLGGPDIQRLSGMLRRHGVPLIVDDTAATFVNADFTPFADFVATSLTKSFSGAGDVMAGSVLVSPHSPWRGELAGLLAAEFEDLFWDEDAVVLERNSRDFAARVRQMNENTERVCDFLRTHPAVAELQYPKYTIPNRAAAVRKPGGGFGHLFSLVLRDAPRRSAPFYDTLRVCKGPSLGNKFTLACPFTLLAHYNELDWAESVGVSRYLIRVSIGMEDPADLIERFTAALEE